MATIPVELVLSHIIPHFHAAPNYSTDKAAVLTLKNFSLSCHLFHRVAQPLLFERITICETPRSPVEHSCNQLSFFLDTAPKLLTSIHTVFLHLGVLRSNSKDSALLVEKIVLFLQSLPELKVLRLNDYYLESWDSLPANITAVLVDHVLPKLITLDVNHMIAIPFLTIIARAPLLEHILLWQWDLTRKKFQSSHSEKKRKKLFEIPDCEGNLECLILKSRIGGMVTRNDDSFGHLNELFRHCKGGVKHLHLGPEIWEKIELDSERGTPNAEAIDISSFPQFDTLQIEFILACKSIATGGSPFSKWMSKNMGAGTNICTLIFDIRAPLPTTKVYEDSIWRDIQLPWTEIDTVLTQMPAFRRFRVRIQRPFGLDQDAIPDNASDGSLDTEGERKPPPPPQVENALIEFDTFFKHALPLCAGRGVIMMEWWDDPRSLVNTAVLERAAT
ncbi:hypothetical protein DL96DRAFT_1682543 [Flagelloscypha sp. PMI_526]|nr:hypothetical protein DL96DRAFT_1682543 [Flagelloscypha sp. PMI_526]